MRKVIIGIIGAVTLLLAGMSGDAEAARLTGCCEANGVWICGTACETTWRPGQRRGQRRRQHRRQRQAVASCLVNGFVPVLRRHNEGDPSGRRLGLELGRPADVIVTDRHPPQRSSRFKCQGSPGVSSAGASSLGEQGGG